MKNDDIISVNKENLKETICNFLLKAQIKYVAFNRIPIVYFSKLFNDNSKIQSLLKSNALILLTNGAIFAFIGIMFTGLIAKIAITLTFLNIISVLISYAMKHKD